MKKFYMVSLVLMAFAGVAFAASLTVPWFVDNGAAPSTIPPATAGTVGMVYLHNNLDTDIVCEIAYYSQIGHFLGPVSPAATTFEIPALSTVAFRPVANDTTQESAVAQLVPNRPTAAPDAYQAGDEKKNGSIVVRWTEGGAGAVQGLILQIQNVDGGATGRLLEYGTLLPPGV